MRPRRFGGCLRGQDELHRGVIAFAMVGVIQFEEHFVRARRKTEQDNCIATCLRPDLGRDCEIVNFTASRRVSIQHPFTRANC
jgi:hypothetical protein